MASNQTLANCYFYPQQMNAVSQRVVYERLDDTKQNEAHCQFDHSYPSATNTLHQSQTSFPFGSIPNIDLSSLKYPPTMQCSYVPRHSSFIPLIPLRSKRANPMINGARSVSVSPPRIYGSFMNRILLDKYVCLERIGSGTFGDIWRVMDKYDASKEYAVKMIKYKKHWNVGQRRRYDAMFVSEGNKIRCLNSIKTCEIGKDFIIACYELCGPCIVLELCGYSLLCYMKCVRVVSLETIRYIALQLLAAMSFMHGVGGMIHADLKPENILIHYSDCNTLSIMPRIKIVDFGNALSFDKKIKSFKIQTLWYRAPEVLFGNKNEMSSLLDLWSVGCILYELLYVNVSPNKHRRLFECRNLHKMDVVDKISQSVSRFPLYLYNKYKCYYFSEINTNDIMDDATSYIELKRDRMSKLMSVFPIEYISLIDLISCLLDLNPLTRYTSEDAIRHRFIINKDNYDIHNAHPIIKSSNDEERQNRINQQFKHYINTQSERVPLDPQSIQTTIHRHLY